MSSQTIRLDKVLVADPVHNSCVTILQENGIEVTHGVKLTPDQLIQQIHNYDGLIVRSETKVTKEVLEAGKGKLKIVGRAGTGVDNIDVQAATLCDIYVLNTPGGNSLSACELTCALISALARHIGGGVVSMKEGRWDRKQFMGTELYGKTLAVIGLGRIGREVASRMKSYGMSIVGFDPLINEEQANEMGVKLYTDIEQLWPTADYITLHVPLNKYTKSLVNETSLMKCRKGVKIVNVARGGIVDETDLLKALNNGQCGGAALDVFSEEPPKSQHIWDLIKHPLVVPTPHLGASTKEAQVRVAEEIAEQFVALTNPNSGYKVSGVINSDVLSALSGPGNEGLIQLARALGSLSVSITPLSSKPTLTLTSSRPQSKWLLSCVVEGMIGQMSLNYLTEAKCKGLQEFSYVVGDQDDLPVNELSLTVINNSSKHTIKGRVNGNCSCLVSIDNIQFIPTFPLSATAKIISHSDVQKGLNHVISTVNNLKSVGVGNSEEMSWICYNT